MGKKDETAIYDEEFSVRVNKDGDTTETILRKVDGVETLVMYGKTSKFKSDKKYRMVITEVVESEPVPETPPQ